MVNNPMLGEHWTEPNGFPYACLSRSGSYPKGIVLPATGHSQSAYGFDSEPFQRSSDFKKKCVTACSATSSIIQSSVVLP